jgi:diaminopimelate epimerase
MPNSPLFFYKLHGCKNSFIILKAGAVSGYSPESISRLVINLCNPGSGIGSDGLFIVHEAHFDKYLVEMYNPDGTTMGMCGNGVRCVVRYLFLMDLVVSQVVGEAKIHLSIEGRDICCFTKDQGLNVSVDVGLASFDPKNIPINSEHPLIQAPLLLSGGVLGEVTFEVTALSLGNPHIVVFGNLSVENAHSYGPLLELHPLFPKRANVSFPRIVSRNEINLTVWERGCGLTLACGTGACASVMALYRADLVDSEVLVRLPGGELIIGILPSGHIIMRGPAQEIAYGHTVAHLAVSL